MHSKKTFTPNGQKTVPSTVMGAGIAPPRLMKHFKKVRGQEAAATPTKPASHADSKQD